jgi:hypothetical protein
LARSPKPPILTKRRKPLNEKNHRADRGGGCRLFPAPVHRPKEGEMKMRLLAAILAAFIMLQLCGMAAYASGSDYFGGMVSVADPPVDPTEPECEIVDVTPRGAEPTSGTITVTDNTEPTAPATAKPATEQTAPEPPPPQATPTEPPPAEPPALEPAANPVTQPFTPSGTGETVDNAEETDGKEFFTITTADENTFYLVIDRQRSTENVYLLDAVTEDDLQSLAEAGTEPAPVVATDPPTEPTEPETEPPTEPEPEKGGAGMIVLVLFVLAGGGGAAWYFKIYRPKQQESDAGDFDGEEDYAEEPDPYGDDPGADDWGDEADETGGDGA